MSKKAEKKEVSLKELQSLAVKEGLPEFEVKDYKSKNSLISAIRLQREKKQVEVKSELQVEALKEEVKEAKAADTKVASLEDPINVKEDKKIKRSHAGKKAIMRDLLAKQLKNGENTIMMLELRSGEKPGVVNNKYDEKGNFYQEHVSGSVEPVQINGFRYLTPRGAQARVPLRVAAVLGESMMITQNAGKEWLLDRVDPRTGGVVKDSF